MTGHRSTKDGQRKYQKPSAERETVLVGNSHFSDFFVSREHGQDRPAPSKSVYIYTDRIVGVVLVQTD